MTDCGGGNDVAPSLETVEVLANDRVAPGVGLVAFHAPRTAPVVLPGQFVHVRIARGADFLLRRPFSVHLVAGDRLEILYQVLGRGTRELAELAPGARLDLIGPLGHGWEVPEGTAHALVVAGGLGVAPMGMLLERLARDGVAATVLVGAPTSARLLAREIVDRNARRVIRCTDDASEGVAGAVTVALPDALADRPDVAYVCGPEAMERAVAARLAAVGVPVQVSLERLMACGIGACLSCVVATRDGHKRACCDGPVFDAATLLWDPAEVPAGHET